MSVRDLIASGSMAHPRRHRSPWKSGYHRPGTAPGTYDTPHVRESGRADVTEIEFDADRVDRRAVLSGQPPPEGRVRWIRAGAYPAVEVLEALRRVYQVDPMVLENVVVRSPQPKFFEFEGGYLLSFALPTERGDYRPLALYLTGTTLVTFADDDSVFAPIEQRLDSSSRLRASSVYYLGYAMIDLAVDLLFPLQDRIGQRLETLEEALFEQPDTSFLGDAHGLRHELLVLRRIAWATREVLGNVLRHWDQEASLRPYLQDSYEHVVTIIDLVETQRDVATSLVEVYLSLASNRLSDVMKVLTIIATLFIPPTFLVGVYGMNFRPSAGPLSMPELGWPYGYLVVLGVIVAMFAGMLYYFRRKGWW